MRRILLALSAAAVAAAVVPASLDAKTKTYVCTKWRNGICMSTHRVKGVNPYKVGYVFGPTYVYTDYNALPQPVVTYYHLNPDERYVYRDGYVYVVDPTTYAITKILDVFRH